MCGVVHSSYVMAMASKHTVAPLNLRNPSTNINVDYKALKLIQNADPYLSVIKQYLTSKDQKKLLAIDNLPLQMKQDLFSHKYRIVYDVLYIQQNDKCLLVLPPSAAVHRTQHPRIPIIPHRPNNINLDITSNHINITNNASPPVDPFKNAITLFQSADPYLRAIKQYVLTGPPCLPSFHRLPAQIQQDVYAQRYHVIQNVLYYHNGFGLQIVMPPPIAPKQPMPQSIHTPSHTPNMCLQCHLYGSVASNRFCVDCNQKMSTGAIETESLISSESSVSVSNSSYYKTISGMRFYAEHGDRLEHWMALKVGAHAFVYNKYQNILICGECDFSFTSALIVRLGGCGGNVCSTAWYYYHRQWMKDIIKEIGPESFAVFLGCLKFCKQNGAQVTFGIDAKLLPLTEKQWNKSKVDVFERVIFTFPRVYNVKWSKIEYNQKNEELLLKVLKSVKSLLAMDGEIHIMLLKGQFFNFKLNKILGLLGLEIAFWCELNADVLDEYFKEYIPRDFYGNSMNLNQCDVHFCSFRNKTKMMHPII
eukprot:195707_1